MTESSDRSQPSYDKPIKVGIVGAGYISDFHAKAIRTIRGAELVCVADANPRNAQSFADRWAVPAVYSSVEELFSKASIDCVHLLVPPDAHFALAKTALNAGINVLLEKPMCTSSAEAEELRRLAAASKLVVAVSHNFLFSSAYQQLRDVVKSGTLGPITHANFNYMFEMPQIRVGPFDAWMLRSPGNLLLETGPHLLSAVLDLIGHPDSSSVIADRETLLPGGKKVFRRWRIRSNVGPTDVGINIDFGPGFPQRTFSVRGLFGSAWADLESDACLIDLATPFDPDIDRYARSIKLSRQLRTQARHTLLNYVAGKLKLSTRGNPFQNSIINCVAAFYSAVRASTCADNRISAEFGSDVIRHCERVIDSADICSQMESGTTAMSPIGRTLAVRPSVLVLGASGFLGRELVRHLILSGYSVRAMVRGSSAALAEFASDRLEIIQGDVRSEADLRSAMAGIEFVYHLAHAPAKTWQEYQVKDIEPTRMIAELCLELRVKRLVYTGTIASYYAGSRAGTITEQTPLDVRISRRDYYARAKAASERVLVSMFCTRNLPLVIFRPGIVIGSGGSPLHWGVGRFSQNICEVWGDGRNQLPLVLNTDVAAALVKGIQVPDIEGQTFNLVDLPLISARDYVGELQRHAGLKLNIIYRPIWQFYLSDMMKWFIKLVVGHPDRTRIPSYADWETRTQKALFDCRTTREKLGWQPASDRQRLLKEGIDDAVDTWLAAIK